MQRERDILRDEVFPELAQRLRERKLLLEPVDLRWGADDQRALEVCLDEVDRCRPFVLLLLGDRRGSVVPSEIAQSLLGARRVAWNGPDLSATELEITYALAGDARILAYCRHDVAAGAAAGASTDGAGDGFREQLRSHHLVRWASYDPDDLAAFRDMVLADLSAELPPGTPTELSWDDEERAALDALVAEHGSVFSGRDDLIAALVAHAQADASEVPWGISIVGRAGIGKTALLARAVSRLRGGERLVLYHAAGVTPQSTRLELLLRRWCRELAVFVDDPIADEPADPVKAFHLLLGRAARRGVVCVLDALDQMEDTPQASGLAWLPDVWPSGATLIASSLPGPVASLLAERPGVSTWPLGDLSAREAASALNAHASRHHKTIPVAVRGAIVSKRDTNGGGLAAGLPLWLSTVVEELNSIGEEHFLAAYTSGEKGAEPINEILLRVAEGLPATVDALYAFVVSRATRFGESFVLATLSLIAVSRYGLRERDLEALVSGDVNAPWDAVAFARLRRYLRAHLAQKGPMGLWDTRHAQFRRHLRAQMGEQDQLVAMNARLARHLLSLPENDPLRASEVIHHLFEAAMVGDAALLYASVTVPAFDAVNAALAARVLERSNDLDWFRGFLDGPGLTFIQRLTLLRRINIELWERLSTRASPEVLMAVFGLVRDACAASTGGDSKIDLTIDLTIDLERETVLAQERIAEAALITGDTERALTLLEPVVSTMRALVQRRPRVELQADLAVFSEHLARVHRNIGDVGRAESGFEETRKIWLQLLAEQPRQPAYLRNLAVVGHFLGDRRLDRGDLDGAEQLYDESRRSFESLLKAEPEDFALRRDLSVSCSRLGRLFMSRGMPARALDHFQVDLGIAREAWRRDPLDYRHARDLAISIQDTAAALLQTGASGEAAALIDELGNRLASLAAVPATDADLALTIGTTFRRLSDLKVLVGDLTGALRAAETAIAQLERMERAGQRAERFIDVLRAAYTARAEAHRAAGDSAAALRDFQRALELARRVSEAEPDSAEAGQHLGAALNNVGALLNTTGDPSEALPVLREAVERLSKLRAASGGTAIISSNLAVTHVTLGSAREKLGQIVDARAEYLTAAEIYGTLTSPGRDPRGLSDRALLHRRLVNVSLLLGLQVEAAHHARLSVELMAGAGAAAPQNDRFAREHAINITVLADLRRHDAPEEALALSREAQRVLLQRLRAAPEDEDRIRDLAAAIESLGPAQLAAGDILAAETAFRDGRHRLALLYRSPTGTVGDLTMLAAFSGHLGDVEEARSDLVAALRRRREEIAGHRIAAYRDDKNREDLAAAFYKAARTCELAGDEEGAGYYARRFVKLIRKLDEEGRLLDTRLRERAAEVEAAAGSVAG